MLLSLFSHVRLCATPETAAHQALPSLGFSRQEHWSGLPFLSLMHESESESEVPQLCLTLCDPMDGSLPGSVVHGIFLARVLEWAAISFSRGSPQPRDRTQVSCIADSRFTVRATREARLHKLTQKTQSSHSLKQLSIQMGPIPKPTINKAHLWKRPLSPLF